jgi:hypothetical protein
MFALDAIANNLSDDYFSNLISLNFEWVISTVSALNVGMNQMAYFDFLEVFIKNTYKYYTPDNISTFIKSLV